MPKILSKLSVAFAIAGLTSLTACTAVPVPMGHFISLQKGNASVYHWEVLADKVASDLNQKLGGYVARDNNRTVAIAEVSSALPFSSIYRDKLEESLLSHSISAVRVKQGDSTNFPVIYTEAKVAKHAATITQPSKDTICLLFRDPEVGGCVDTEKREWAELVVTSRMVENGKTSFLRTDNYYVPLDDVKQYEARGY